VSEPDQRAAARATWAAGDFDAIAERIWGVGDDLIGRVGVESGNRVLDVACGTGNAAIPAAVAGAKVTGLDITPELFADARRRAADAGVEIEWIEGDAEELPFEDAAFDVVVSTFGCMFAPNHAAAAAEIARVLAPGGRIGIAAWQPQGSIGQFFATIAKHAPPPPDGFQPPPLWGVRDHVNEIFDGTGVEVRFEESAAHWRFDTVDEMVNEYATKFGPVVRLREALEPQGRWEALREDLVATFGEITYEEDGGVAFDGDYLITLGRKPSG
jgi:ubiquinone/menaquinone biosynthesis C-methylase UbiE